MTDHPPVSPLPPERLFTACDTAALDFATTAELEPLADGIGQERAAQALRFAIGMRHSSYHVFASGPAGTGKHAFVCQHLRRAALTWPVPSDWCYLNNFAEPHRPRALELPPGRAAALRDDMARLIDDLKLAIPSAFESEDYRTRRNAIQEQFKERQEDAFNALQERAKAQGIALIRTPVGFALAVVKDGEVLSPKEFQALPEDEQARNKQAMEELQAELEQVLRQIPDWEKEQREELRALNRETTMFAVGHLIDALKAAWADFDPVARHLEAVREDAIANAEDFLPKEQPQQGPALVRAAAVEAGPLRRYEVNVVVDNGARINNGAGAGAPVIDEDHPTHPNLVGRVEHLAQFGTLVTDFTMIKAGALHRANGGCLILDARKLLMQPFAWESLKRALRARCIRIESPAETFGWSSTITLEPEPIPLNLKLVLLGEPLIYYLLSAHDPEFAELFRVQADFETRVDRDGATKSYARLIGALAADAEIKPLERGGVARVIEHSARLANDSEKLLTHTDTLDDLLREANFWAGEAGAETIQAQHVQRAIDAKTFRSDRIREALQEQIERGTIVVETEGAWVGQINGLAVLQLHNFAFGKPSRITCRVRMGKGEVVDIEREVALGGPLHTKGVLILASYLSTRYASDKPLSLSAHLVFEQSYGGVDGDSASSTELYALISALSGIPIKQSLAVTGSVDQNGRVQAIGGVNEKIEGFFDICSARGLTGEQGVLIPETNVKHLMLRQDVVEACREGRFRVYPVKTIDQGIEILTGVPAGAANADGQFPIGSVNRAVAARLDGFARKALKFSRDGQANAGKKDKREGAS